MEHDPETGTSGLPMPPGREPGDGTDDGPPDETDTEASAPRPPLQLPPLQPVVDPVATARRRYGTGGAIMAAGMLGIDQVLGRRVKEEAPIVIAASDQPVDIDTDGITVPVDEVTDVVAPPQPRPDPYPRRPRRRRR